MRILRSRFFRSLLVIAVLLVLLLIKVHVEKKALDIKVTKEIYTASHTISKKKPITRSDLTLLNVPLLQLPEHYIENEDDLIGKYVINPVSKGDFLLSSNLSDYKYTESKTMPDQHKIVAIKLTADQAGGWQLQAKQHVDIAYAPSTYHYETAQNSNLILQDKDKEQSEDKSEEIENVDHNHSTQQNIVHLYQYKIIKDVIIVDIIDETLLSVKDDNFSGIPSYILVQVNDKDAQFITMVKDKGRFDIMITPNK